MKIKNNRIDLLMEAICLILLIGITLYLGINWSSFPDKIPAHYDWAGNIDRWGSKGELLIVPIMSWFLYLMITALEQIPMLWNTGVQVTVENMGRVYRVLKYMIKSLKMIMVMDFTYLTVNSLSGKPLSGWFTLIVMAVLFGDLFFWIWRLFKAK